MGPIIIVCVLLVACIILWLQLTRKKEEKVYNLSKEEEEKMMMSSFEEKFFEETEKGASSQVFIEASSLSDCSFIQSLLFAERIPSHLDHQHASTIYGQPSGVPGFGMEVRLSIITDDYDRALSLIREKNIKGITVFPKTK